MRILIFSTHLLVFVLHKGKKRLQLKKVDFGSSDVEMHARHVRENNFLLFTFYFFNLFIF